MPGAIWFMQYKQSMIIQEYSTALDDIVIQGLCSRCVMTTDSFYVASFSQTVTQRVQQRRDLTLDALTDNITKQNLTNKPAAVNQVTHSTINSNKTINCG